MDVPKRCSLIYKQQLFLQVLLAKMHERQIAALVAFQLTREANKYGSSLSLNQAAYPRANSAFASSFAKGSKFGQIGHLKA